MPDRNESQGGFPRPFKESYAMSLGIAILALSPFIVITTAFPLYRREVSTELAASRTAIGVIFGLATAGYAFGAMFAGDVIQRFRQRVLFFTAEGLFIAGALLVPLSSTSIFSVRPAPAR